MNEYEKAIEWDETRRKIEQYNMYLNSFPSGVQEIFYNCYFDYDLYNWILTKDNAINVLNLFQKESIKILGIDTVLKEDNRYQHNYDNWFSESCSESLDENFTQAMKFINEYNLIGDNVYFVITIAIGLSDQFQN